MAILTDKEQTLVRTIGFAGMPAQRTSLTRIMSIDFDRHTLMQESFVSNIGVQFGITPLGLPGIGLALLLRCALTVLASGPLTDVCQVLQADEAMGVLLHNALTHHMVRILLQPSLSPADLDQSPGGRTSAFVLKTLPESRIMVGFGNNGFPRMEGTLSLRGAGDSQVTDTYINPDDLLMGLGSGTLYLYFQRHEEVELLLGLVIPEFGRSHFSTLHDPGDVLGIRGVRHDHTSTKGQDTHLLVTLETVVIAVVVGECRSNKLGRMIQPFVAFLGQAVLACLCILLDFGPQCFIGGSDLTGDVTSHLCWQFVSRTYLLIAIPLQSATITHLAMLKSVPTDSVQSVTIGQLGLSQLEELLRVGVQFEFGGDDLFHRTSLPESHTLVNKHISVKVCANSSPRREAGGLLGADVE